MHVHIFIYTFSYFSSYGLLQDTDCGSLFLTVGHWFYQMVILNPHHSFYYKLVDILLLRKGFFLFLHIHLVIYISMDFWIPILFNGKHLLYVLSCFSRVWHCVILWTVAHQAPLSIGFSRQEYWSGLSCHPPGVFPDPGIELVSLTSLALADGFLISSATWEI